MGRDDTTISHFNYVLLDIPSVPSAINGSTALKRKLSGGIVSVLNGAPLRVSNNIFSKERTYL